MPLTQPLCFIAGETKVPRRDRIYPRGRRANYNGHDTEWVSFRTRMELFRGFWPWLNSCYLFATIQIARWFLLHQKPLHDSKALSAPALPTPPPQCLVEACGEPQGVFLWVFGIDILVTCYILSLLPFSISCFCATVLALPCFPAPFSTGSELPFLLNYDLLLLSWASAEPGILINKIRCCPPGLTV